MKGHSQELNLNLRKPVNWECHRQLDVVAVFLYQPPRVQPKLANVSLMHAGEHFNEDADG